MKLRSVRRARIIQNTVLYAVLAAMGFAAMYMFIYIFIGSFTTQLAFEQSGFFPKVVDFWRNAKNYLLVFDEEGFLRSLIWTLLRVAMYFVINVFLAVMGGYVFAKYRFPFKRFLFIFLLSSMMIPGVATLVPNYIWMSKFPLFGGNNILGEGGSGLIENPAIMFITGWVNVYAIFLCRQAFRTVEDSLGESAEIDGAGFIRIVFTIYMPLIRPILAVIFLNTFIGMWNDFMTCLMYLPNTTQWHTIGKTIDNVMFVLTDSRRSGGPDYPKAMAVSIITMIPPVLVYILMQKQFVEGLALGGVKG